MFNRPWSIDYSPVSPGTEDALSSLFQNFSGNANASGSGSGGGLGMGVMDVDLGLLGIGFHTHSSATTGAGVGVAPGGNAGMDPSSFLAMLGGEPLSNAPFLPTFDSYSPPAPDSAPYSPQVVQRSVSRGFEPSGVPDSDLAILAQFWEQNLREMT